MDHKPGAVVAGYTIERVLGRGGMGSVFLARHPRLPRQDALKMLSSSLMADESFRTRFEREADLAAQLFHRNIVAVYDRGEHEGRLWIAMQYVEGTDAAAAVKASDGGLDPARAVHIVHEVGAGLDFAHRTGLLHRDVKPANILLAPPLDPDDEDEPEQVLLTDFGIAKTVDDGENLTGTGNMLATIAYASPEQIEARHLTHKVDIYALGCVLYELLTGSIPFPADTPFGKMNAHLTTPPPRPSEKVPGLGPAFDEVVARAMAKDPEKRYATCRELSRAARAAMRAMEEVHDTTVRADPERTMPAPPRSAPVTPPAPTGQPVPPPEDEEPGTAGQAAPGADGGPGADAGGPAQGQGSAASPDGQSGQSRSFSGPRPPFTLMVRRFHSDGSPSLEVGPVDTREIHPRDRASLENLLNDARFFDLPPRLPLERIVAGDHLEEITVGSGGRTWTVAYERHGARHPELLDQIAHRLARLAQWHPTSASPAPYLRSDGEGDLAWSTDGNAPRGAAGPGWTAGRASVPAAGPAGQFAAHDPGQSLPPGRTAQHDPSQSLPPGRAAQHDPSQSLPPGRTAQHDPGQSLPPGRSAQGLPGGPAQGSSGHGVSPQAAPHGPGAAPAARYAGSPPSASGTPPRTAFGPGAGAVAGTGTGGSRPASRRRVHPAAYVVIAVLAVALLGGVGWLLLGGGDDDGTTGTTPGPSPAPPRPASDWDGAYEAFPELLPASPGGTGYNEATCADEPSDFLPRPDGVTSYITCTQEDGLEFVVLEFDSTESVAAFVEDGIQNQGWVEDQWHRTDTPDVPEGDLLISDVGVTDPGFIHTSFVNPVQAFFVVSTFWEGHDREEISDEWWAGAPF